LKAQLQKKNLDLKLARTEESRQKKLLDIEAISQGEYDIVANKAETLEAEKNLLLAQLVKTEIKAPFSGTIGLRYVSNGGYVSPNTKIAVLQQLDPIKIEFSIPESYSSVIKNGAPVRFKLSGSEEVYTGSVYATDLAVDPATRTIRIRARSANPDRKLVPGSFAKIELNLGDINNAIMLPSQAIIPELNGQKVFVVENGKARSVKIGVGVRTESDVQVTEGLKRGDSVVVSGILQLKEGSNVVVNKPKTVVGAGK
jgi:membrane fusion protein (multidrug efflux system)